MMSIVTGIYTIDMSMAAFLASAPNIPVYPASTKTTTNTDICLRFAIRMHKTTTLPLETATLTKTMPTMK